MKKTLLALSVAALAAGSAQASSMLTKLVRMSISMVLYVLSGKARLTKLTM